MYNSDVAQDSIYIVQENIDTSLRSSLEASDLSLSLLEVLSVLERGAKSVCVAHFV